MRLFMRMTAVYGYNQVRKTYPNAAQMRRFCCGGAVVKITSWLEKAREEQANRRRAQLGRRGGPGRRPTVALLPPAPTAEALARWRAEYGTRGPDADTDTDGQ